MNGLANSIAQGQAQRVVEMDCHGGPVSKMSGPPETTASLARGGLPFIPDSASEQWLQSDNMEMPMFSPSEGPQQSAPTAVTLAAAAPAAKTMTGTRVFPAVSSKGVAEAPASSAGAALVAVPAAAPATGGTVLPTASVGGGGQGALFCRWNSGIDGGPGNRRYCSLRCISSGGARVFRCSSGIGGSGGIGHQR